MKLLPNILNQATPYNEFSNIVAMMQYYKRIR